MDKNEVRNNIREVFISCFGIIKDYSNNNLIDSEVASACIEATGRIVAAIVDSEASKTVARCSKS